MSLPTNGTEGQDRESYFSGPSLNELEIETAICALCGAEEETADLEEGLCLICRTYPEDSYEWHRAICFDGEPPSREEADAFRSGWLRALDATQRRLKHIIGIDLDLGLELRLDPKEAKS